MPATLQDSAPYVMWATLAIFDTAVITLLRMSFRGVVLKDVLREKAPAAGAVIAAVTQPTDPGDPPPDLTSYSRVSGMVGTVVLACFIWGLSNAVLYDAFVAPAEIEVLLKGTSGFILASSALFAPYAVNKLNTILRP